MYILQIMVHSSNVIDKAFTKTKAF